MSLFRNRPCLEIIAWVLALLVLVGISLATDAHEALDRLSRAHEGYQLDGIYTAFVVAGGLGLIYPVVRVKDLYFEVSRRLAAEENILAAAHQKIKIDRSFVASCEHGEKQDKIDKSIIGLGSSLGLKVTAEGIEHESQLEKIEALGCGIGQGYLLGMPLPAKALKMAMVRFPVEFIARGVQAKPLLQGGT